MRRRTTPSSDEFRGDLHDDPLTFDNQLARERTRVQRRRQGGQQRNLSERLEGHTTLLSAGVGRSPILSPIVMLHAVRDALRQAMEFSGLPTAPPAGVGVAPNVFFSSWRLSAPNTVLKSPETPWDGQS